MTQYMVELALWMTGLFLVGCLAGAVAHRVLRSGVSGVVKGE